MTICLAFAVIMVVPTDVYAGENPYEKWLKVYQVGDWETCTKDKWYTQETTDETYTMWVNNYFHNNEYPANEWSMSFEYYDFTSVDDTFEMRLLSNDNDSDYDWQVVIWCHGVELLTDFLPYKWVTKYTFYMRLEYRYQGGSWVEEDWDQAIVYRDGKNPHPPRIDFTIVIRRVEGTNNYFCFVMQAIVPYDEEDSQTKYLENDFTYTENNPQLIQRVWMGDHPNARYMKMEKITKNSRQKEYIRRAGDCDGDGYVGSADAGILNGAYGSEKGDPAYDIRADFDFDDYVGSADAAILNQWYGT